MRLPLFGGEYIGPSTEANPQECVNLIAEVDGAGGLDSLLIRPGLSELADLTDEALLDEVLSNGGFDSDADWTADTPVQWEVTGGKLTRVPGAGSIYEHNVLANPDFNGNINGWGGAGWAYHADSGDARGYLFSSPPGLHQIRSNMQTPPTDGVVYQFQATVYCDSGNIGKTVYLKYYNGTAYITVASGTLGGGSQTISGTFTMAANIESVSIWFDAPANNNYYYCSEALLEAYAGSYGLPDTVSQLAADMAGTLAAGITYRLTFTVSGYSGGYVTPVVGGTEGTSVKSNGSYSMDVTAGDEGNFAFVASAAFAASIDNVSLKEVTYPQNEVRGLHVMGGYLYVVHGNQLKRLDSDYEATTLTTSTNKLSTSTGPVTMAHIFDDDGYFHLMINDGSDGVGYLYKTSDSTFSRLATTIDDFYGGGSVTSQDGMFVSHRPESDEFYISNTRDGADWDILDVHTAEAKTSNITRVLSAYQNLWVFKGDSIEEFYNSGASPVWQRSSLALIELGALAPHSPALIDNALIWLANDRTVRVSRGSDAQIVSTHHISRMIEKFPDATDAIGYGFSFNNHSLYVLTFPAANRTLVYDLSNGLWYEYASFVSDGSKDDGRYRGNCYANFNNIDIVGDYENNKIYKIDQDVYTDDGNRIRRTRVFSMPKNENKHIFMHRFELDLNTGSGAVGGHGENPQAMLQISRDGGKTYGNEMWQSIGAIGSYNTGVVWRRLGKAREPVFRITISDPIQDVWIGAYLEGEEGYA